MYNEGPEEESRVQYASALHPKHSKQPIVRRRHSGSTSENGGLSYDIPGRHSRSRADSNGGRNDGGYHHPLRLNSKRSLDTSGVTRPYLNRTLNGTSNDGQDRNESDDETLHRKEDEAEVIVHEITPTDSLAGVSLKYGISLADLRRANHLWANDSIHLRRVLYIPLDMSLKARDLARDVKANVVSFMGASGSSSSTHAPDSKAEGNDPDPPSPDTPNGTGLGIRRVPTSRMSFFPPPATSGKTPSISSTSLLPYTSNLRPSSSHARYSTSPSLVSILTALPIAASTRDDLIARLSFDSTSSSVSERSRSSPDRSEGHELYIVANHEHVPPNLPHVGHRITNSSQLPGPSSPQLRTAIPRHGRTTFPTARPNQPRNTQTWHLSTTPPAAYIPHVSDRTSIRTVQMEPSPVMQLPKLRPSKSQLPSLNGISICTPRHSQDDLIELE
ncbi:hypothetical protein D9756_007638 [Leucocoprinus leucothites]|uniref:LysM domain-containing protein n=1 Tax=Leucocoprinus leucothites TaxID=201217 RepID=A0A8H5D316_9AGAR|nr:hypothetical protein D9756_007638 [Leucoagaricus leucothites]